jgi:hypothetical protein
MTVGATATDTPAIGGWRQPRPRRRLVGCLCGGVPSTALGAVKEAADHGTWRGQVVRPQPGLRFHPSHPSRSAARAPWASSPMTRAACASGPGRWMVTGWWIGRAGGRDGDGRPEAAVRVAVAGLPGRPRPAPQLQGRQGVMPRLRPALAAGCGRALPTSVRQGRPVRWGLSWSALVAGRRLAQQVTWSMAMTAPSAWFQAGITSGVGSSSAWQRWRSK